MQSEHYTDVLERRGLPVRYLPLAGHDHFSILEALAQPGGAILKAPTELVSSWRPSPSPPACGAGSFPTPTSESGR